jgi:tetratricopeptide (TPR) repeat protein
MRKFALATFSLLALTACAHRPGEPASALAKVRPVNAGRQTTPADAYYLTAASAIERRDYGQALDMLQVARRAAPHDIRILNAFGVVYDKLGRFDLSSRYYAEAKAIDPASPIVANNVAYSRELQSEGQAVTMAKADEAPVPFVGETVRSSPTRSNKSRDTTQLISTGPQWEHLAPQVSSGPNFRPNALPVAVTPQPAIVQLILTPGGPGTLRPFAIHRPLVLINASGRPDVAALASSVLSRRGWSVRKTVAVAAYRLDRTTVRYPAARASAARALARTLPGRVRLASCDDRCQVISISIGADATRWRLAQAGLRATTPRA